jgi:hypothetical protein
VSAPIHPLTHSHASNQRLIDPIAHNKQQMLTFDPRKRITVTEALAHPFFEPVHEELGVHEPSCPVQFDGSFEKDYPLVVEMPKSLLRRYMFTVRPSDVGVLCRQTDGTDCSAYACLRIMPSLPPTPPRRYPPPATSYPPTPARPSVRLLAVPSPAPLPCPSGRSAFVRWVACVVGCRSWFASAGFVVLGDGELQLRPVPAAARHH